MVFKGLTQRAQRILTVQSQEEARHVQADQLLPEHILIAILKDGGGTACKTLDSLKVDVSEFRQELERDMPRKSSSFVFGDIPPSRRARTMLESAAEEARNFGHEYVGTEHLLVAAAREEDSLVQRLLSRRTVTVEMLRIVMQTSPSHFPDDIPPLSRPSSRREGDSSRSRESISDGERPAKSKTPPSTPLLDDYSRDLTALAAQKALDPVIGRQKEIDRTVRILARRTKNNPVLVGEPGVGKTAVVEGLAQLMVSEDVPDALAGKRLLTLDIASMVAGTKYRGEFEDRVKKILKEITLSGRIILFIDEIHTIIGAGGAEGTIDAANMLKPALSRGQIQCIGATTLAEYRRHFERDAALERRFQPILVEEPSLEDTVRILKGIQRRYEDHHAVRYTDEAVSAAGKLAQRYVAGRFMPDKAIDLLDEAGAMKKLESDARPAQLRDIESEIKRLAAEKASLVATQKYEAAAEIRDRVRSLRTHLELTRETWERAALEERPVVDQDDIRRIVSESTGIPLFRLEEGESRKLLSMEKELHRALIGQSDAVSRISAAIRRSRSGVSSPRRPQGSFIFLGPTGVGKTLLAKRLAQYLFGSEDALVRIDMSDYMEKHNASRLVGAPPGYVGYEEGGVLTERIRRNPYRVILFDEIEKAHRDVFNLLLQVLEEGELKDQLGHTVSFRNTVIIMTSNAGARDISREGRLGFDVPAGIMGLPEIRSTALAELRRLFNPEFINRVDDIVVFHSLDRDQVEQILDLQISELVQRLWEQGFSLSVSQGARKILAERGWDPKYGARPLRRILQKEVEEGLASSILERDHPPGTSFIVEARNGVLRVKFRNPAAAAAEKSGGTAIDSNRQSGEDPFYAEIDQGPRSGRA